MRKEFDAVKQALAAPRQDKKPAKVREIRVRKGHKGGYICKHVMDANDIMGEDREYPITTREELHKHIDEHFGDEEEITKGKK